ncbi:hypothetical protein GGH12_004537 [Coemansia sp. RSA 1822]|nr:hypothetical protein LPJ76_004935 [Coemansia sp. RSA 638]KAJ2540522.1 hypothetical protein GGF49_004395 [Coemansia sp. RSA 1853]KAJ2560781.1 hypothetical protein GGH12_004537 [Coemansia sp. RSA 1822]
MEPGTHRDLSAALADSNWHKRQTHCAHPRRQPGEKDASVPATTHTIEPKFMHISMQGSSGDCCIVPKPVRSALEFVTDMAQLAMPSLFMADMEDGCAFTKALCNNISSPLRQGGQAAVPHNNAAAHNVPRHTDEEPGDVFGFDSSESCACTCACCTSHCCFSSSVATMRNWKASVLQSKNVGLVCRLPSASTRQRHAVSRSLVEETLRLAGATVDVRDSMSQHHAYNANNKLTLATWPAREPPAYSTHRYQQLLQDIESDSNATKTPSASGSSNMSTADDAAVLDHALISADKLLLVNQYLLRRIRKLELTNQIIKEAYVEVSEILDTERQYNTTQLQALRRKHDEDLEKLVEELTERANLCRSSSVQSFISEDDAGDMDYMFKPGFTTTRNGVSVSCTSSPLMGSSTGRSSSPLPPGIPRSVSDTTFTVISDSMSTVLPCELSIEFMQPASENELNDESESESEGEPSVVFESMAWDPEVVDDGDESDVSGFSEDSDNDDSGLEFNAALARQMRDVDITTSFSSGSESDSEFDSDYASDTESESGFSGADYDDLALDESNAPVHISGQRITTDDYASIDPVRAVIDRYYPQSGKLCISADIDDVVLDPVSDMAHRVQGGDWATSEDFNCRRSADSNDDAVIDMADAHDANPMSPTWPKKTAEELEMEHNAQLPADQRLAKFIHRASSHLQQGARGGLTLGFMLHNLEVQAEKFASNHVSVLCAFIESMYQLAESTGGARADQADATNQRRSALSKKQRDEASSPKQAVMRIVRLLHTFITAPEDQLVILQQLEALSEANSQIRPLRHAQLLRILYESELVDRSTIIRWYTSLPGVKDSELVSASTTASDSSNNSHSDDAARVTRGKLLRENASALIIELATEEPSSGSAGVVSAPANAMDELHHQIQLQQTGSLAGSTSASTPCVTGVGGMGTLTPVSEESQFVLRSQTASGHESSSSKESSRGRVTTSTSYVSVLCRTGSVLNVDHEGFARQLGLESAVGTLAASAMAGNSSSRHHACVNTKPAKQVTFAAN